MSGAAGSGGISRLLLGPLFEAVDDADEVELDRLVYFDEPLLAALSGVGRTKEIAVTRASDRCGS
jgi:hypothetical protein